MLVPLRRQVSELVELAGVDRLDVHEVPTHGGRGQLEQQPDLFGVTSPGLMAPPHQDLAGWVM
jgi:hypothetical protein